MKCVVYPLNVLYIRCVEDMAAVLNYMSRMFSIDKPHVIGWSQVLSLSLSPSFSPCLSISLTHSLFLASACPRYADSGKRRVRMRSTGAPRS